MQNHTTWLVAKTRPTITSKVSELLTAENIPHYIPEGLKYEDDSSWSGMCNRTIQEMDIIFICYPLPLVAFFKGHGISINYLRSRNEYLPIPDEQVQNFIRLYQHKNEIKIYPIHEIKRGVPVKVIGGAYEGIEGEWVRIKRTRCVVVRVEGLYDFVTPYIPREFLKEG